WGEDLQIIGNVLHDAQFGINQYWRDKFTLHVSGNIFSRMSDHLLYAERQVASRSSLDGNLLWNDGKDVRFRWGQRYNERARAASKALPIAGARNFTGDPSIERIDERRIRVSGGMETVAPCLERLGEVNAEFTSIYGETVSVDTPELCATKAGNETGANPR
ncbi:MAG: hypothetical protein HKN65_00215, partial [Woeseiaceae bacterium]|nr:hypothetical protein [Woeseiaceae bacterium]